MRMRVVAFGETRVSKYVRRRRELLTENQMVNRIAKEPGCEDRCEAKRRFWARVADGTIKAERNGVWGIKYRVRSEK